MQIEPFRMSPVRMAAPSAARPASPEAGPADGWSPARETTGSVRPTWTKSPPPLQLGSYPSVFFAPGGKKSVPSELQNLLLDPATRPTRVPSQRWVVTPGIEASHFEQVKTGSPAELEDSSDSELRTLIGPLLRERYGDGAHKTVMELGPATSTTVAETLTGARYLGVDLSGPYLEQSSRMLDGRLAAQHYHALGDTYGLPVQEGSCDVVLTSCHPPFVSANPQDKCQALDEVARALAPGGEFLLFPWNFDRQPPEVNAHLLERFELADRRSSPLGDGREVLVLKKR